MNFIELTHRDGHKICINLDNVSTFLPYVSGETKTRLYFSAEDDYETVKESYEAVKTIICTMEKKIE